MQHSDLTIKIKIAIGPFCGPCSDHIMPLGVTLGGRGQVCSTQSSAGDISCPRGSLLTSDTTQGGHLAYLKLTADTD